MMRSTIDSAASRAFGSSRAAASTPILRTAVFTPVFALLSDRVGRHVVHGSGAAFLLMWASPCSRWSTLAVFRGLARQPDRVGGRRRARPFLMVRLLDWTGTSVSVSACIAVLALVALVCPAFITTSRMKAETP